MSWLAAPRAPSFSNLQAPIPFGEVLFLGPELQRELIDAALEDGYLAVTVPSLGPAQRGRLGWVIEESVESALTRAGACPPGVRASVSLDASLSDQLYRARLVERRGLAVALPSLEGISNAVGALDVDDSTVLRWWMSATRERPLRLYLLPSDRLLGVYGPPVPLIEWVPGASAVGAVAAPQASPISPLESPSEDGLDAPANAAHPTLHAPPLDMDDSASGTSHAEPEPETLLEVLEARLLPGPENDGTIRAESEPEAIYAGSTAAHAESEPEAAHAESEAAREPSADAQWGGTIEPQLRSNEAVQAESADEDGDDQPTPALKLQSLRIAPPKPRRPVAQESSPPSAESLEPSVASGLFGVSSQSESLSPADATSLSLPSADVGSLALSPADATSLTSESSFAAKSTVHGETHAAVGPPPANAPSHSTVSAPSTNTASHSSASAPSVKTAPHSSASAPSTNTAWHSTVSAPSTNGGSHSPAPALSLASPSPVAPLFPNAEKSWLGWMRELDTARGPKPLSAIERMFVTSYVPLRDARARGIAGPEADEVLSTWSKSFEQSYKEAFGALRVRGKRPNMVLDVPELALRMGRLHGARTGQLIVVDGMRYDLGLRVENKLRALMGQNVALTERVLLWAALPSTTAVQLELLGRGSEGLKDAVGTADNDIPVARGRSAATLRRVRTGQREVLKLDLVEWRLSDPGAPEAERLDALGDEVAAALAAHFERLQPRTLAMVFGDHGFVLDPLEPGTRAARQGGASPDEVLVPGMAWLVGGVH